MSALIVVAALAAQATGSAGTPSSSDKPQGSLPGISTYVDLEAGAGYSSNSGQSLQSNSGAGFGRIGVHAVHTRLSERTSTVLSAFAQSQFYTQHYGAEQSVSVSARHEARVSEKLHLWGEVDTSYDKGGQLDTRIITVPDVPLVPGTVVPPPLLPPGSDFLSVRGKHYNANAYLGGDLSLGARDSLNFNSGFQFVKFRTGIVETRYTTIPVSIGYSRQISPRASAGVRVSAEHTDYNGPTNFGVVTPQLTGQLALSETMTLNGAVGVSFTRVDDGIDTNHSTGFAADVSLCSATLRGHFCARGSIDQTSATSAGPAKSINVGLDYSRQLDANQTIAFSLNANRYTSPTAFVVGSSFSRATYFRAAVDYSRKIGGRLFGGVNLAARKISEDGPDPKADVTGSLFIRYRLGDIQ
jgi:hypothetical protein